MHRLEKAQLKSLYDVFCGYSRDVFILCDLDLTILDFNPIAEKYYGINKKSAVGQNYNTFCQNHSFESLLSKNFKNVHESKKKTTVKEIDGIRNIFSWKTILPKTQENDDPFALILLGRNITNITEENHLENLNFYLDFIVSKLPGNFYWKNKEGIYLGCADDLLERANLKREDVIGKTDFELWPIKVADRLLENDHKVLKEDMKLKAYESILTKKQSKQYFIAVKMPLKDQLGNIIGVIGNSIDITEQVRAEERLKREKEKLKVANEAKTEFLLNMRHDLRTPFNGILGFSTYMENKEENPMKKEQLGYIRKSSATLLKIIDEIFESFQVEHDLNAIVEKELSIKEISHTLTSMFLVAVKEKGLTFTLNYDPKIPATLLGDRANILRILINLLGNAVKFTNEGGIKVSMNLASSQQSSGQVMLEFVVEDTGIGIPKEKHDCIFEKFSKLNPSFYGGCKGLGLGLSVVKEIVTILGGKVGLESAPGQGSLFFCTIPLKLPDLHVEKQQTRQTNEV